MSRERATGPCDGEVRDVMTMRVDYLSFIESCLAGRFDYRLTLRSEPTPFALCFAIFGHRLVKNDQFLDADADSLARKLKANLVDYRAQRDGCADLLLDKPFMQMLAFTLSSLRVIGRLDDDPLDELVTPLLPAEVRPVIRRIGALDGVPQSGNKAMFVAILLIHARDYLGRQTQAQIDEWVELHIEAMNERGFWGRAPGMTHLQFQNGYHQYEIFEYLGVDNPKARQSVENVRALADGAGHFAPYPGGGGCYDFDAVSVLTQTNLHPDVRLRELLMRTRASILDDQNADGGFAESQWIRPRSLPRFLAATRHVLHAPVSARFERLKTCVNLQRPKHDRIHTHWSEYSRRWAESNLWDSWFRALAVAKIDSFLAPDACGQWGFIDYPGIGYHAQAFRPGAGVL